MDIPANYEKLRKIREKKDLPFWKSPYLMESFVGLDGKEREFKLRYYQIQMVLHLMVSPRFVVGDDTGCGKTIEAISALCYLWERLNPNQKIIILTKKSAVTQWAKEFLKFTRGVHVVVHLGTPKDRKKAKQEFVAAKGPTVLVSGYRSMVQDFSQVQNWKGMFLILDECFQYHTPVTLGDGSQELIGRVVNQHMPVEVLSWNSETNLVEPRKVIAWHKTPFSQGRRQNLLHLNFRFGGKVRVTHTHKFHAPSGSETPAHQLHVGSQVQHLCHNSPSADQWQLILGGLLGDSCLSHPERPQWGVQFGHAQKQEAYLSFKHAALASLGTSLISSTPNGGFPLVSGGEKGYSRFRLNANAAVTSFLVQAQIWQQGRKRITVEWLDKIGPLGLAIWYADDGSLQEHLCIDGSLSRNISISTHGFAKPEVVLLAGWLRWRWGIQAQVKDTKPRQEEAKQSYSYLYLGREAASKFLALLPCGFPGVEYKFPGKSIWDAVSIDCAPCRDVITDWVTEKSSWTPPCPKKDRYVYNLEVEGNHNYFANGTLVSNCTMVKTPTTQVHQVVKHMASQAERVWGLTATLIKNNLVEGFGIYQVVVPGLFNMTKGAFIQNFCITRMQMIGRGRQVPIIVGYRMKDVLTFRGIIDPYYLGRPKHEIAEELPALTTQEISCEMTHFQALKYQEALSGILELGTGEEKQVSKLTAITYCQEIVNHPALIDCDGDSDKLDTLVEILTDGDMAGEKVIVFTRFERMVTKGVEVLAKAGVPCVRITGKEKDSERSANQDTFQDFNSGVNTVWVTTAGSDAINLQAAKAIIFYDTPFSAGDYLQCLDDQTEILTRRGFVGRVGILLDDDVAAMDPKTSEITWQAIRSKTERPLAEGEEMWNLVSSHVDVRVTGGHRMLFNRQTSRANKERVWPAGWRFETAKEMSQEKSFFRIPVSGVQQGSGLALTDAEISFIGWFVTDGTMNKRNHQVVLYQAEHQPQIEDLRRCIKECGFDFHEYRNDRTRGGKGFPNGKPLISFSIPKGGQGGSRARNGWGRISLFLDKQLAPALEGLSTRQLGILLEAIHLGDGTKFRGQPWTRRSYQIHSGDLVFVERLQSLCVRRGFRCNVKTINRKGQRPLYRLSIKACSHLSVMGSPKENRPRMTLSASIPGEMVWCVENDVGTLVTRRNGKVAIVGNCLGRMIRIGSIYDRVYALHLICTNTVDERVMQIMSRKMDLVEAVLGKRIKGEDADIESFGEVSELFDALRADAQEIIRVR